jgi:site-specific DNA recombinase
MTETVTKAIITARFSPRPDAQECDSCDKQIERCRDYCKVFGWEVLADYRDEAKSGATLAGRDQLELAIQHAIREGAALVFWSYDRLSRDQIDAAAIFTRLDKAGVPAVSVSERIDCTTPAGRCMRDILIRFAQMKREETALRTAAALRRMRNSGRKVSSDKLPTFGWKPDPNSPLNKRKKPGGMLPVPEEQEIIRQVLDLAIQNYTPASIAASLRAQGKKFRSSNFRASHVRKILTRARQKT